MICVFVCLRLLPADYRVCVPQAREASVDFDTDDEVLIKKDGPKIDRTDTHAAASTLDMDALFQMEEEVPRPLPAPVCACVCVCTRVCVVRVNTRVVRVCARVPAVQGGRGRVHGSEAVAGGHCGAHRSPHSRRHRPL